MADRAKAIAGVIGLVSIGAILAGSFFVLRSFGPYLVSVLRESGSAVAVLAAVLLLAAWIVSRGLSHGSRRAAAAERAALYEELLAGIVEGVEGTTDTAELERRLTLTARRSLLDRYRRAISFGPRLDPTDEDARAALEALIAEMRRDLALADGPFPPEGLAALLARSMAAPIESVDPASASTAAGAEVLPPIDGGATSPSPPVAPAPPSDPAPDAGGADDPGAQPHPGAAPPSQAALGPASEAAARPTAQPTTPPRREPGAGEVRILPDPL